MQIRPVDPARDGARCAEIYAPYVRGSVASLEEVPPAAAEFEQRIERGCATHPWLIAELDAVVAGFAYASAHRERAAYRWAADVSVYVEPRFHRRGVARTLYGRLFPLLIEQGLLVACAGITLPNSASVALHESFGFQPVGVYRRIGFKHGAWHDVGWWQRPLGSQERISPPEPRAP